MLTLTLQRASRARPAKSLLSRVIQARAVARQRKALADLDDSILSDIGITRAQAEYESERPAWDVPQHWMK
ncbi:DUF1127 domain-containing protein [Pacificibacter marinus]|uniref:DUF1127 domain-containing protein n=1 Tax=Pacificibacter marinus TaxID=658057 RepID=UPI001C07EB68|nr:DUF1127 domain-containing protein [Pacificibacter marinus]MBU2868884.1 DUF1127 domain-containing protein [Pacificibacter marinus]